MTAGYSGTPLAKKLGIRPHSRLALINDPGHFFQIVELPAGVDVRVTARGKAEVVVFFTSQRRELERRIKALSRVIYPAGALWVCWPKRASKVPTDMTEDAVREVALPLGLVDIKVAAIDEVWSGLKIVHRLENR